ncbi:Gamma-glutamyl phosphate reductase [Frankliniella fusca]|uniref:Gamma-glutamyl phosphate reductase n=1 Tax=Frankliniella fusca TaxID=407009 RepID=A0AAE1HRS9_9NEOP|nr:Gamma-glutamyl phosphate reductase [Frankliniella fusca]
MQDENQLQRYERNSSLRYDSSDVILPNVTVHMLVRCMDEATNSVLFGSSVEALENSRTIADSIRDNFITAIINAVSMSSETTGSEPFDADIQISNDSPSLKLEKEEKSGDVSDLNRKQNRQANSCDKAQTKKKHTNALTMDVPEFAVYCMRGVRCRICWFAAKGVNCVQRLINHTVKFHPEKSAEKFLDNIQKENSFEKVLGNGLPYCTCSTCICVGYVGWEKKIHRNVGRTTRGKEKKYAL